MSPLLISPCHQPTEPQIPGTSACPCYPFTVSLTSGSPWRDLTAPSVIWPSQVEGPKNLLDSRTHRNLWAKKSMTIYISLHFLLVGSDIWNSSLSYYGLAAGIDKCQPCWIRRVSKRLFNLSREKGSYSSADESRLRLRDFVLRPFMPFMLWSWLLYWIYFDPKKLQAGRTTWEMINETSKGST